MGVNTGVIGTCFFRREDILDAEVSASGFTRQMEKDLLAEIGWTEVVEEESESENVEKEEDIDALRAELEQCFLEDERGENDSKSKTEEKEKEIVTHASSELNKRLSVVPSNLSSCDSNESLSDAETEIHSVRSVSTTSTIPPEVIQQRVKKTLEKRNRMATRQRCLAKGEASAVTRKRRENRNTIKDSAGIWGLD